MWIFVYVSLWGSGAGVYHNVSENAHFNSPLLISTFSGICLNMRIVNVGEMLNH